MHDVLRTLIVERIKATSVRQEQLVDVYLHLISIGVQPEDAIAAMSRFVDEIIAVKARGMEPVR